MVAPVGHCASALVRNTGGLFFWGFLNFYEEVFEFKNEVCFRLVKRELTGDNDRKRVVLHCVQKPGKIAFT